MILLSKLESLLFEGCHHSVEHVYDPVGFALPYVGKAAREVLGTQEVDAIGDRTQWPHDVSVEDYEEEDPEERDCAYYFIFDCAGVDKHQCYDGSGKYENN